MKKYVFVLFAVLFCSCRHFAPQEDGKWIYSHENAPVSPAYGDSLCIPFNLAPLNFCFLPEDGMEWGFVFFGDGDDTRLFEIYKTGTRISVKKWRKLLGKYKGKYLPVRICGQTKEGWVQYKTLHWYISPYPIDPYLLFRASQYEEGEHGYLYLRQRNLTNFKYKQILDNRLTSGQCMNCHDCLNHDAGFMTVHLRVVSPGTLIIENGRAQKVKVPDNYQLRLTYPAWHPSGKYIAYSTNLPHSVHYANAVDKIIYTLDTLSNIVILDVEKRQLFSCPELTRSGEEAVFPTWSADGKRLYYCVSPRKNYAQMPFPQYYDSTLGYNQNRVEQVWADVKQIDFNPETRQFSNNKLTYPFSLMRKSATMPRLTPGGGALMVSLLKASTFPLQNLGDFYLLNLQDSTVREVSELNTPGSEKGHSFSSNGKWMVFSSSRRTMAVPETYITFFDSADMRFSKPFLVPQKRGDFYLTNLKGFVFPVLCTEPAVLDAGKLARTARGGAEVLGVDESLDGLKLQEGQMQLRGGH